MAYLTTAVSISGINFFISAQATSSPVISVVGMPRCPAIAAVSSPSQMGWPFIFTLSKWILLKLYGLWGKSSEFVIEFKILNAKYNIALAVNHCQGKNRCAFSRWPVPIIYLSRKPQASASGKPVNSGLSVKFTWPEDRWGKLGSVHWVWIMLGFQAEPVASIEYHTSCSSIVVQKVPRIKVNTRFRGVYLHEPPALGFTNSRS